MTQYNLNTLPKDSSNFILDANILVYLHGPFSGNSENNKPYTKIAEKLIRERKKILIDVIALSEFINIYINQKIERYKVENPKCLLDTSKKHIRRSLEVYKEALLEIKVTIKNIEETYISIEWVKGGYNFMENISSESLNSELMNMEFNDFAISKLAETKNAIIVTNDRDLINCTRVSSLSV